MLNLFKPKVRTRFAPSPTGYLHIGGLRTALYAYLFAKQNKGVFYLRVEDTDQSREVAGAVENLLKSLKLAGIIPDEGIISEDGGKAREIGHFGPYTQSQRLDIYRRHAQQLVDSGKAYYCFCTPERLEVLRHSQEAAKQPTRYDGLCRKLSPEEVKEKLDRGEKYVIRMKVEPERDGVIEFEDLVRGKISVHSKEIDDQILIKADGFPTYHLAHIVDDHLMKTTHIIRAEEWLPSTPKHILLFKAFGWQPPRYAHLSLIVNPDRSKLSKRQGDVAVEDYLAKGYLPEAIVNYVALLGWNPGTEQEIFSLKDLLKEFSFDKIHKASAVFDIKKLDWMNGEYIKKLPLKKFVELARPYLEKNVGSIIDDSKIDKIMKLEQQRVSRLSETGEKLEFLFTDTLGYDGQILVWKKSDAASAIKNLGLVAEKLSGYSDWSKDNLEKSLIEFIKSQGLSNGEVLWPLRVALTGQEKSPTPFEVAEILGKEKTLVRIKEAIEKIKN
jgi:glutamyl-tRNA synthetase